MAGFLCPARAFSGTVAGDVPNLLDFTARVQMDGELPQGLVNSAMQFLHFDDTDLYVPSNEEFQTWLDGVPDKNGPTCE